MCVAHCIFSMTGGNVNRRPSQCSQCWEEMRPKATRARTEPQGGDPPPHHLVAEAYYHMAAFYLIFLRRLCEFTAEPASGDVAWRAENRSEMFWEVALIPGLQFKTELGFCKWVNDIFFFPVLLVLVNTESMWYSDAILPKVSASGTRPASWWPWKHSCTDCCFLEILTGLLSCVTGRSSSVSFGVSDWCEK